MAAQVFDLRAADASPGWPTTVQPATAWVLSDGKAGDEGPAVALVEALDLVADVRRLAPRRLFAALGIVDPAQVSTALGGSAAGSLPDIAVASGRRAVPYLVDLKRRSGGSVFTVFLKDPRRGAGVADLIWVPEHDGLRGANVVVTTTGPHFVSAARLEAARAAPDPRLARLARPRVAVLAGGDSRHHRFRVADIARFLSGLDRLAASGASLMMTPSRRTPPELAAGLMALARRTGGFFWDGAGHNPYLALMALADAIVATADSTNIIGEAAATGRPVLVFTPSGGHPRLSRFLRTLNERGITTAFTGRLEGTPYPPLDATPVIASAVAAGLARHRAGSTPA